MRIYALDAGSRTAPAIAAALGARLARHEDRSFDDGEPKGRPQTHPRGVKRAKLWRESLEAQLPQPVDCAMVGKRCRPLRDGREAWLR